MNFLNRVKQAAEQVSHQIRDVITSPSGPVVSRAQTQQLYNRESPRDVLVSLVHSVCGVIDQYAISDSADTMEGDRVLYESNAREYLRKIIELLVADGGRWVESVSGSSMGSSDVELECVDAFLQTNAMHELCRRAGRDLPRGCLPMILAFISSLLRQVRYPLLPHQTIYKPLTKLLSITCRFDAMMGRGGGGGGGGGSYPERSLEAANYARRVDTALCSLLGTLWRKIAENPAVLDFFFHEDTRMGGGSGGAGRLAPQMDVLSALLPLVQRPRVGQLARDALLVALSVRDVRVDAFLVHHTDLLRRVAESLGQQFAAATVSVMAPSQAAKALLPLPLLPGEGKSASGSLPGSIGTHVTPVHSPAPSRGALDSRAGPVDAFLRSLRLMCLIVVAASPQPNLTLLPPSSLEQRDSAHSVRAAACEAYCQSFLEGSLRVLLTDLGDELASVSATSLLRYALRELELFQQDSTLLALSVRFLLDLPGRVDAAHGKTPTSGNGNGNGNGKKLHHTSGESRRSDFVCGLVLRCSSMFPQVSLASTQLVSALLQLSSLEEAFHLLAKGIDPIDEIDNPAPSTPAPSGLQQQLDVRINNSCKALVAKASAGIGASPVASWLAPAYVSAPYIDAAAHEVLARLARRSASSASPPPSSSASVDKASPVADGLSEYLPGSFSLCDVSEFLQRDWAADDGSAILGLVRRRLGCFLSLKLDEQVATAGLVSQVLALFCTAVVSATEVDNAQGGRCLDYMLEALRLLEGLWVEVARHLADAPELEAKAAAMQQLLHASAKGDPADAQCVKLFEREPARTVRVLETGLVLRELVAQTGGYLHAAERLRVALTDPAGPFAQPSAPRTQHPVTDADEDEWDCEQSEPDAGLFPSVADVEAAFERDYQEALKSLEAAVVK